MNVDFAQFDIAELEVLDTADAIGLPEMGASIEINYVSDLDEMLGDDAPLLTSSGSCSCCCCCC